MFSEYYFPSGKGKAKRTGVDDDQFTSTVLLHSRFYITQTYGYILGSTIFNKTSPHVTLKIRGNTRSIGPGSYVKSQPLVVTCAERGLFIGTLDPVVFILSRFFLLASGLSSLEAVSFQSGSE